MSDHRLAKGAVRTNFEHAADGTAIVGSSPQSRIARHMHAEIFADLSCDQFIKLAARELVTIGDYPFDMPEHAAAERKSEAAMSAANVRLDVSAVFSPREGRG